MSEEVQVSVWRKLGAGLGWGMAGVIDQRESLALEPRYNQPGTWSMRLPYGEQAQKVTKTRLLTFDYRGTRMTGVVTQIGPASDESGKPMLEVTGVDALWLLAGVTCWPSPAALLSAQAGTASSGRYKATGAAETVLRALIVANAVTRLGNEITIPASAGRGLSVTLSERFSNLLAVTQSKAAFAGLGVRMGLVNTSGTRATLTVNFSVPADKSNRVHLSHRTGSLRAWKQTDTAPTVTRAIVGGSGQAAARVIRQVTAPAAETEWGFVREVWVDARDESSTAVLDERGQEALAEGVEQSGFELEAVEPEGIRYGLHYQLGDLVEVRLLDDLAVTKPLGAVQISESVADGVRVQLIPGNPDATSPLFAQAAITRRLNRQVSQLQREEG